MRIAAILFVLLTLVANFIYNNITSLVVAILSYPLLLWVLLKRKKKQTSQQHEQAPKTPLHTHDRWEP